MSDQPIQTNNDNLFYKNVRDILDDKGTDDNLSSFEDGDAPKGHLSSKQLKMVESLRESLDLTQGHKIYDNLMEDSAPTKHTSNVVSGKQNKQKNT